MRNAPERRYYEVNGAVVHGLEGSVNGREISREEALALSQSKRSPVMDTPNNSEIEDLKRQVAALTATLDQITGVR